MKKNYSVFDNIFDVDKANMMEVFSLCLGRIMANQIVLGDIVIRGREWNIDFDKAVIMFGKDKYKFQFIGSESSSSGTWLWGWENINNFNESIISLAAKTKEIGHEMNLECLTTSEFKTDELYNGHTLSVLTSALSEENIGYYRCPYEGGAAFVGFYGFDEKVFLPVDGKKFLDVTMQSIQSFDIDHKIFTVGFLTHNKTPFKWKGETIIAEFSEKMKIDFEDAGGFKRISKISFSA